MTEQKKIKLVTIVGARPQFIKAAAVSREIKNHPTLQEIIIHTGQHFDLNMSDIFFEEMNIPRPDYKLEINSLSHGAMTGRMLEKIEDILSKEKPDWVLVYGDTNSTIAGALAAKKMHIKVVHVEAGLRSFNMRMPEEINRILTDRISDILCCPTDTAVKNLNHEGVNNPFKTGDVMQDAALYYSQFSSKKSSIIQNMNLSSGDFVLCTIHRAENTDDLQRLKNIFAAIKEISQDAMIVMPLHPRLKKIIGRHDQELGNLVRSPNLKIIPPVGYFDMIELLKNCQIVLTDSGGLQKEAFFFSKPCVTVRDETEWVELVDGNYNIISGANADRIVFAYKSQIDKNLNFNKDLYGGGHASQKIVSLLISQN